MIGRTAVLATFVAGCLAESTPPEPGPDPFEQVWSESIRSGDLVVVVPGTGSHTGLGLEIEAAGGELDARRHINDVDPVEGAIAAAQRAGHSDAELEAGAVTFALWGTGITKFPIVRYTSVAGLHIRFEVIGGSSTCGDGGIPENLPNYNGDNGDRDARDLYMRIQTWLAAAPPADRNVTIVSHSWGGLVAEFFATHLAAYAHDLGPLASANVVFAVAAGVPPFVPGYNPIGPGFRTVDTLAADTAAAVRVYEVDRPDDPVHGFSPTGNGNGHHYIIMDGDRYLGWYGISTDELSCAAVPGICPPSAPTPQ